MSDFKMNKEQTRKFIELLQKYDNGTYTEDSEGEYLSYREGAIIGAVEHFIEETVAKKAKKASQSPQDEFRKEMCSGKCRSTICPRTLDMQAKCATLATWSMMRKMVRG